MGIEVILAAVIVALLVIDVLVLRGVHRRARESFSNAERASRAAIEAQRSAGQLREMAKQWRDAR